MIPHLLQSEKKSHVIQGVPMLHPSPRPLHDSQTMIYANEFPKGYNGCKPFILEQKH